VKAAAERDASTRLTNFLSRWTGDGRVAVARVDASGVL
jgi:hypothetical protein